MRLRTFYVKSYRSIIEAKLDDIQKNCVIVGPNNAGKSNLLRAVYIALSIALEGDFRRIRRNRQFSYAYNGENYNWERDIPVSLKNDKNASTVFKLTFEFSDEEKNEFKDQFKINLSKSLQMKFQLFSEKTEYNIIMPGRAKAPMEKQMQEIGLFIRSKLDYQYIPCVRSSDLTDDYFSKLISKEFKQLESSKEYLECKNKMIELQLPIIQNLEKKLCSNLQTFLPDIQEVSLSRDDIGFDSSFKIMPYRYRHSPIAINDGNLTSIDDKGDGTKSLIAISLIQSMSFENLNGKSIILCIEEPEAHLHPEAVHSLKSVLIELSKKVGVQVFISTHSPILIDTEMISNNVIVGNNHRVSSCESIPQIRNVLGVRLNDNLAATKVVLTEGESDKRYFETLCRRESEYLENALNKGFLKFESADSASKMDYQIRMYNSIAVSTLVILDSDDSGLSAYEKLTNAKTKLRNEVCLIKSAGMVKCELEDVVDQNAYSKLLKDKYQIFIENSDFKKRKKPWSDRLHIAASKSPGFLDDSVEAEIKKDIATIVEEEGMDAIAPYDREYVNNIIKAIESFVK